MGSRRGTLTPSSLPRGFAARDDVLDRVRLHRQVDKGPILFVEGSPDRTVLRRVLLPQPQIFPCGPKAVALTLAEEAIARGLGPLVAVVDRDFDGIVADATGRGLPVIAFDDADLESMLWATSVLDESLVDLGSEEKVREAGGASAVRSMIDELILPLQRLRAANQEASLGLDFDQLDLRSRIRATTLSLSVVGLCDSLRRNRVDIPRELLMRCAESYDLPLCPQTGRPLFRGKDRLAALGVALRRRLGSLRHQQADMENIARVFYANARREAVVSLPWLVELENVLRR